LIFDIGEDCRSNEITAVANALSAAHQLRAFLFAGFDVAQNLLELVVVHLRTLFGLAVQRIAYAPLPGAIGAARYEFVIRLLFDKDARTGAAALALVKEEREM